MSALIVLSMGREQQKSCSMSVPPNLIRTVDSEFDWLVLDCILVWHAVVVVTVVVIVVAVDDEVFVLH